MNHTLLDTWRLVQRGEIPSPIKYGERISLFETTWLDDYADRLIAKGATE